MSKYRRAARIDDNQPMIIEELRKRGISVKAGMDDILVGHNDKTYWFELKDPEKTLTKKGTYKKGAIKESQIKLSDEWKGHYKVVHCFEQILEEIGFRAIDSIEERDPFYEWQKGLADD